MTGSKFEITWGDEDTASDVADSLDDGEARQAEQRRKAELDHQRETEARIAAAEEAARPGLEKIPRPYAPSGDGPLTVEDERNRQACIAGIKLLDTAYWIAGKAMDTMATARLFRDLPRRDNPEECYTTIEDFLDQEFDIKVTTASKLRAAWEIAEELHKRGYDAPEGQVRHIVPVRNRYGLMAAVVLYEMVAQNTPRVTGAVLAQVVKMLPDDLPIESEEDPQVIQQTLEQALPKDDSAQQSQPSRGTALPAQLKRVVDKRALTLADKIGRGRITRHELLAHLLEAFADDQDSRVFDAVLDRMREQTTRE